MKKIHVFAKIVKNRVFKESWKIVKNLVFKESAKILENCDKIYQQNIDEEFFTV
jgi:hypothetical protein